MSGQHARLSASAAHRWLVCPGSIKLSEGQPDSTSEYAAAGTFAHHIAAETWTSPTATPEDWLGNKTIEDGHTVECTQEMVDAVQVYLDVIRDDKEKKDVSAVEVPLLGALQRIDPDLGGTADFVRYRPSAQHLRVFDFKYGSGVYVEVESNEQMMLYALGAMLTQGKPVKDVTVTIVQPRFEAAETVRDWHFKAVEILDFVADIKAAAEASRREPLELKAGDHCKFCKAARVCPELEQRQHALVAAEFGGDLQTYDPAALAKMLISIPLVKERIKAIEEFAYKEACAGKAIPGFKLVDKRATRKWKSEGDVIEWAEKNAIDPYERKLKSPAQLDKVAGKGEIDPYVEKVSSGTVLVPDSDNRQPAKQITATDFEVAS